uniref:VTT domain-containing protein n=1 Tax=Mucochytrium quahogii TaxID=96639 RepID=A0A7S2SEH5_9STRA|mmetsp:Transcript_18469/g.30080  ORF Transcript_18469/g.30080 Transcript_18469/m.30080 type:complete len:412 (+) Transcript_18469:225-1460(+)|eukprot:CAMPEP_0203767916 /NCGR_PEP_ID=MMETSP0099_2-20121227/1277_1 /ASSEMBLY_ACC=CAM_ASM_000209 /TAXON_ID=96639 /ORGANISM=" , Strain NY0313808BC1" /LENGTH=411 /DNA_ID=CAMNT_0050664507 /DNA_START=185 /DNA_END=1420 /DNA_ORIENTATION=+
MARKNAKQSGGQPGKNGTGGAKVSEKQLTAYKIELHQARHKITPLRSPLRTLVLFSQVVVDNLLHLLQNVFVSPFFLFGVVPLLAGYGSLRYTDSVYVEPIDAYCGFVLWWFGLGVLSSVGLGSGMHSGILFLFPHMFRVVAASKRCPTFDFDSKCDTWWRVCEMECRSVVPEGTPEAPFWEVVLLVVIPAFLWGAGTAAGEIPPYAVSRAAALAGREDDEVSDALGEAHGDDVLSKMKAWMIDFVEKYGFWGVLVMSAWPNAAFDLVGICCGQLNVSFWTFFIATLIGKAVIKVNGQAVFFCWWFRNPELVIKFAVQLVDALPDFIPISPTDVERILTDGLEQVSKGKTKDGEPSLIKQGGELLVLSVIVYFAYSCVAQFAQQRQKTYDDEKAEHYRTLGVKDGETKKTI